MERKTFGVPIAKHQLVMAMIADMAIGIETARLAWMRASWEIDQGKRNTYYASIAKAYAADLANKCATDAVQVHSFITVHFSIILYIIRCNSSYYFLDLWRKRIQQRIPSGKIDEGCQNLPNL